MIHIHKQWLYICAYEVFALYFKAISSSVTLDTVVTTASNCEYRRRPFVNIMRLEAKRINFESSTSF